jgi:membrane protein DedA with SNARE-associated domain
VTEPASTPEPLDPIELSVSEQGRWHPAWRVGFGIGIAFAVVLVLWADAVVAWLLISGAFFAGSGGLGGKLAVVIVLPVMTLAASWLFWVGAIRPIADLRTDGEFSRTRSEAFRKAEGRFARIAIIPIFVIPFVPILAVLD